MRVVPSFIVRITSLPLLAYMQSFLTSMDARLAIQDTENASGQASQAFQELLGILDLNEESCLYLYCNSRNLNNSFLHVSPEKENIVDLLQQNLLTGDTIKRVIVQIKSQE